MSQIDNIIDSLNDIGYSNESMSSVDNPDMLKSSIENDILEFSRIVSYLTYKLSNLLTLEEKVNPIQSDNDRETLFLEISSFLKEVPCPYRHLTVGPINERFNSNQSKVDLLDFLTSEVLAAKIVSINKPKIKPTIISQKINESEEARALVSILKSLCFPKPPPTVSITEIWSKIENKLKNLLSQLPKGYLGSPLLNALLSNEQWKKLMEINQILCDDFKLRRELLLTRLDVTIQSFKWADRLKKNNNEITDLYHQRRKELSVKQNVKIYDILAARDDLLNQEKTCSTRLMCRSDLHKIIIPKVPDRGGRTCELEPPPPEMPKFSQRKTSANPQSQRPNNTRGGRGGGYNNRQNNNNNNWNQPQSDFERFQNQDYHGGEGRGGHFRGNGKARGGNRY